MATSTIFDRIVIDEEGSEKLIAMFEDFIENPDKYAIPDVDIRKLSDPVNIDRIAETLVF